MGGRMGGVNSHGMISTVRLVRVYFEWLGDEGDMETFDYVKRHASVQTALGWF